MFTRLHTLDIEIPKRLTPQNLSCYITELSEKYPDQLCEKQVAEHLLKIILKYNYYNKQYENPKDWLIPDDVADSGNPHLIDMMFTGCKLPFAYSTFNEYNDIIERDIFFTVQFNPQSINSYFGQLRCRDNITPFAAACYNKCIPLHIINLLLEYKADPTVDIIVTGKATPLLKDLEKNLEYERYNQIMNIVRTKKIYIAKQYETFLGCAIKYIPAELLHDIIRI